MGNKKSKSCKIIGDNFESYEELEMGLRKAGLEASQLIVGIDFTKSNLEQGDLTYYDNKNLHSIDPYPNPYQQVLNIMCNALEAFDEDNLIPTYGFGDSTTKDKSVFSFCITSDNKEAPCHKLNGVLEVYNKIIFEMHNGRSSMSGPTTFAPLIHKAIDIVKTTQEYHILLIICDGSVNNKQSSINAIIEASKYPLSIICVGVGKGPWDDMIKFDDMIPKRAFDNFQFVNFHKIMSKCENKEVEFAKHALMEIPYQYEYIKKHLFI